MPIEINQEIEGKVTNITKFGAFIELPESKVGLVHISQIAEGYVTDITKHLVLGQVVKVRIIGVTKDGKFDLSIKQVGKPVWQYRPKRTARDDSNKPAPGSFEDKITNFLKQSEEKLVDFKRNLEVKQTGKKKKKPRA
ncbi:MAG: S1 RNA-binding domain-containing protein [Candidatus Margulisiibacteriota bacterium]